MRYNYCELKEWLDCVGLTQSDLAMRLGVDRGTVNAWANKGEVPKSILLALRSITEELKAGEMMDIRVKYQKADGLIDGVAAG